MAEHEARCRAIRPDGTPINFVPKDNWLASSDTIRKYSCIWYSAILSFSGSSVPGASARWYGLRGTGAHAKRASG